MRICFVTSQFPETHETFILREFVALRDLGLDFFILSLKPCRDAVVHPEAALLSERTLYPSTACLGRSVSGFAQRPCRSAAALVRCAWLAARSNRPVKTLAAYPFALWCAAEAHRLGATAIHAHWATLPSTVAMEAARLSGLAFSLTAHAWDIFAGDGLLDVKLARARFVITCTGYNVEALCRQAPDACVRSYLVYHGLDTRRFSLNRVPARDGLLRLLSIGRFVETKGFTHWVNALQLLKARGVAFRATMVGEGPLREAVRGRIVEAGLSDDVQLPGTVTQEEIRRLLAASDVFALPCVIATDGDRDGIPNVILEAMAAGLPIVSTTVSGIPEAVADGRSGLLVAPGDAEALAGAVMRLAGDQALREALGREAKRAARERFELKRNALDLYEIFTKEYA